MGNIFIVPYNLVLGHAADKQLKDRHSRLGAKMRDCLGVGDLPIHARVLRDVFDDGRDCLFDRQGDDGGSRIDPHILIGIAQRGDQSLGGGGVANAPEGLCRKALFKIIAGGHNPCQRGCSFVSARHALRLKLNP